MTPQAESPHGVLRQIHRSFAGDPGDAYRTATGRLSFDQLHRAALALAQQLTAATGTTTAPARTTATGTTRTTGRRPMLIWGHKDPRYLVAYWACLLAGLPLVPTEPDTPPERLRQIAQGCNAAGILVAEAEPAAPARIAAALQGLALPVRQVDLSATPAARSDTATALPADIAPDDVAYIMFSSGTLGQPKGIQVTYANLADFIRWQDQLLAEAPFAAVTGNIRHCFDVSLFELWSSWCRRCPITALNHAEFANSTGYIRRLQADQVGLWVSTPSIARLLLRNRRFTGDTLPALSTFLFCGEALTKQIVQSLFDRFPGCRVLNTYGPTECTVAVTSVEITPQHLAAAEDLPIGYARPGTTLTADPGPDSGEILIRGSSVGRGYLDLPDKQARAFPQPGCYRTGDRARRRADGLWYFGGRIDREIKVQGVRVDLDDIEAHIRRQPDIEDAVVEPYVLRGEPRALNAYVFGGQTTAGLKRLADQLARDLPPYLVPRFWYAGFGTPLNRNSKIDRAWLADAARTADHRHVHSLPGAETLS